MHWGRIVQSLCRKRRCNLKIAQRDRVPVGVAKVARVARVARVGGEEKKHEEAWMAGPESGDRRGIYQIYQQRLNIELWKENEIEGNIRSRSTLEMSFVPRLLSARLACVGDQDKNCLRGNL